MSIMQHDYYDFVRIYIVFLVLFSSTLLMAYGAVRLFCVRTEREKRNHHSLATYLCIFSLSVAGVSMMLVPIKIMAVEGLQISPDSDIFRWVLDKIVTAETWNVVFALSLFSLFVIIPFAYFYCESMAVGSSRPFSSKLLDAFSMLLLSLALVVGYFYLLAVTFFKDESTYLAHFYSVVSGMGSLFFLVSAPRGFFVMLKEAARFYTPINFSNRFQEEEECLVLEMRHLRFQGKDHSDQYRDALRRQQFLCKIQALATFRRNVALVCYSSSTAFCLLSIIMRVVFQQLNGLFDASEYLWSPISLFFAPMSKPGEFYGARAILDQALIFSCVTASMAGYYNFLEKISCHLQIHNTSVPAIILNSAIVLLISFSLPTVVHILGQSLPFTHSSLFRLSFSSYDSKSFDLLNFYFPSFIIDQIVFFLCMLNYSMTSIGCDISR
eukprot:TRINITY_DN10260_c0_g1_i1.p1 TRINITY_DN10260_c0_g1~~TRINITY_DN10260_c0_g1_i1.p1  ORF type:complete len:439 (-),score=67.32 TRINITY_DN10260_c0_g1_i1:16-1332(-)